MSNKISFQEMKIIYEIALQNTENQLFGEESPYGWNRNDFVKTMTEELQRGMLSMKIEVDENGNERVADDRVYH